VTFKEVRVKLVIAEVSHTSAGKTFRKLISPVLSKLDVIPEFGMFHSALMFFFLILNFFTGLVHG
jgi:hypothetical protein